jgi:YVTN family beta-propeller protein
MKNRVFLATALFLCVAPFARAGVLPFFNTNAYVPNNNGTLSVIDTPTDTVIATISGFNHPFCATVSPNGKLLYVCNEDNSVVAVDTTTNTVITHIALPGVIGFIGDEGSEPQIAFSPLGERAFVISSGGGVNSQLFVINTFTNTVINSTSFGSTFLLAIAAAPLGDRVFIASSNGVQVVDAYTLATIATIAPGHEIFDLALTRIGFPLYASDESGLLGGTSGVLVIDTIANAVITTVPLPASPSNPAFVTGLALTPDNLQLYAEELFFNGNSTVTVINTLDSSVNTTITANGTTLTAIAPSLDGTQMLAVNSVLSLSTNSSVDVITTADNTISNSITVGIFPISIATQPLFAF